MSEKELPNEKILDIDLSKEMQESFLEYSYSVIYARALPDARDGLKRFIAASSTKWVKWV